MLWPIIAHVARMAPFITTRTCTKNTRETIIRIFWCNIYMDRKSCWRILAASEILSSPVSPRDALGLQTEKRGLHHSGCYWYQGYSHILLTWPERVSFNDLLPSNPSATPLQAGWIDDEGLWGLFYEEWNIVYTFTPLRASITFIPHPMTRLYNHPIGSA